MSPQSDIPSNNNCQPNGRPPGNNNDDVEQRVPFDSNRYPDGANTLMYMEPPSSPPTNRTHDRKHQKKKRSHSQHTKPNKLNLLSPLPDFRLYSVHHSVKYDREQSRADKSSASSDHTSINKHHPVCHLNSTNITRRLDAMMMKKKKKRRGVVKSMSILPAKSKLNLYKISPTLLEQRAYSFKSRKKKKMFDLLENIPEAQTIRDWNLARQSKEKRNRNLYLISFV